MIVRQVFLKEIITIKFNPSGDHFRIRLTIKLKNNYSKKNNKIIIF
jgi:hypothetical protein